MTPTQLKYLIRLSDYPGPVSAQEMFTQLRMSKLSVGRMADEGMIAKEIIDGRSHYRLTSRGFEALPHPDR